MPKHIRIVAPSGKTSVDKTESINKLNKIITFLKDDGYEISYNPDIYSDDIPYHSNNDEFRAKDLIDALTDPNTYIIWCIRGGYGSARLYDYIKDIEIPNDKVLIGFSDITALHLILSQGYKVKAIHGHVLHKYPEIKDKHDFQLLEDILFNKKTSFFYKIEPLNDSAKNTPKIQGELTGGNLCVINTSIGTKWQIQTKDKILLLEDIDEPGYKIDRMLNHMKQAHLLEEVKAVVLGNFSGNDPYINTSLERFAKDTSIPVYKCDNFGHGEWNYPFQYGTIAEISLDNNNVVSIELQYNI